MGKNAKISDGQQPAALTVIASQRRQHIQAEKSSTFAQAATPYDHLISPQILDASPDCIKIIRLDGRLRHMNWAGCDALKIDPTNVDGVEWARLLPTQIQNSAFDALHHVGQGQHVRFHGLSEGGEAGLQHWDNLLTPLRNGAGLVENILCISRNVTGSGSRDAIHQSIPNGNPGQISSVAKPDRSMIDLDDRLTDELTEIENIGFSARNPDASTSALRLTQKEIECLFWVRMGKTAWETSIIIGRSRRTVEFHIAKAVKKLRAVNKNHASNIAFSHGLF